MKVIRVVLFLLVGSVILVSNLQAQQSSMEIAGLYVHDPGGLLIEKLPDGNYIFRRLWRVNADGTYEAVEGQAAYVRASSDDTYLFYWHTGRYEDIPGTNAIIVYEVVFDGEVLDGTYWFPEQPRTPPVGVVFRRHE